MKIDQNEKLMLLLIALFKCLPTFALDTYSPAIPEIAAYFAVKQSAVLITFTSYYIGFAFGILIWGLLSDVYGRKRILQLGALLYVLASIFCPLASSLHELLVARFGQGLGDAACATVAVAVLRDCYTGKELLKIMTSIGSLAMVAPMIAPIIGVSIIAVTKQWQYIFHFLTLYGLILLFASYLIPETILPATRIANLGSAFKYYLTHLANYPFILYSLAAALICAAALSFISSAAIIYLKIFQLTKWEFAFLFAINSLVIILANFCVKKLADLMQPLKISWISFICALAVLALSYLFLERDPHSLPVFIIGMSCSIFFMSISANTLGVMAIGSVQQAFGVAVSLKNFLAVFCAGLANYALTKFSDLHLQSDLILQQVFLLLLAALVVTPLLLKLSKMETV